MSADKNTITALVTVAKDTLNEMGEYDLYKKAKSCLSFVKENKRRDSLEAFEDLFEDYSVSIVNGSEWLADDVKLVFSKKKTLAIGKAYQYLEKQSNSILGSEEDKEKRDQILSDLYSILKAVADTQEEKDGIQKTIDKVAGKAVAQQPEEKKQQNPVGDIFNNLGGMEGVQGILSSLAQNENIKEVFQNLQNSEAIKKANETGNIQDVFGALNDPNVTESFNKFLSDKELIGDIFKQSANQQGSSTEYSE